VQGELGFCVVTASALDKRPSNYGKEKRRGRARLFKPKRRAQLADKEDRKEAKAPPGNSGWFIEYSREFLSICQAQFEVLAQLINASLITLYLRRDGHLDDQGMVNEVASAVEFVPMCTYPEHGSAIIVGDDGVSRPMPQRLPGGIAASTLLPEYPYFDRVKCTTRVAEDGSLTVPIVNGQDLVGMLVMWKTQNLAPADTAESGSNFISAISERISGSMRPVDRSQKEEKILQVKSAGMWTDEEKEHAHKVANTLALACSLDQRTQASERSRREQLKVLSQLQSMLSSVLHQVRSPLGALVTFGKLLLRRLPVGDVSRDLARDIVVQSERMQELLIPLDEPDNSTPTAKSGRELPLRLRSRPNATDVPYFELEAAKETNTKLLEQSDVKAFLSSFKLQTCWLSDVAERVISAAQTLAAEASLRMIVLVDRDAPPCQVDEKAIQEAMSNILDNAITYSPSPGTIEVAIAAVRVHSAAGYS